jgi:hypothetical protein
MAVVGNPEKGSGESEGLLSIEYEHFLGCERCMGNEGLWTSCSSGHLRLRKYDKS